MAIFLPVAPPRCLQHLRTSTRLNAFYLAHEVVKDPIAYLSTGCDALAGHSILDNSAVELGGAVDFEMVSEAAHIVKPNVVVLPDALEDGETTYQLIKEDYALFYDRFRDITNALHGYSELMAIPQGNNLQSWLRCAERIMNEFPTSWIGIPRNTTGRIVTSRVQLIQYVRMLNPKVKIHLLGFSNDMFDDMVSAQLADSIDSAVPVRIACFKTRFQLNPIYQPRAEDWWSEGEEDIETMIWNVIKANQYAGNDVAHQAAGE